MQIFYLIKYLRQFLLHLFKKYIKYKEFQFNHLKKNV
jgi:hypothetical protein